MFILFFTFFLRSYYWKHNFGNRTKCKKYHFSKKRCNSINSGICFREKMFCYDHINTVHYCKENECSQNRNRIAINFLFIKMFFLILFNIFKIKERDKQNKKSS